MDPSPVIKLFGIFIRIQRPELNLKMTMMINPKPYPSLPPQFFGYLVSVGASSYIHPILIFSRRLSTSDVNRGQARLAMPRSQILNQFLTNEEELFLQQKDSQGKAAKLPVSVMDSSLNFRHLKLSRWNYSKRDDEKVGGKRKRFETGSSWSYTLIGGWNDVVKANGFCVADEIQIWAFRMNDGSLGLLIDNLSMRSAGEELIDVMDLVFGKKPKFAA